jgi:F0F1-type ATP synthase membrane subunit b/b'
MKKLHKLTTGAVTLACALVSTAVFAQHGDPHAAPHGQPHGQAAASAMPTGHGGGDGLGVGGGHGNGSGKRDGHGAEGDGHGTGGGHGLGAGHAGAPAGSAHGAHEGKAAHAEHGAEHDLEPINWASFENTKKSVPYVGMLLNFAALAFIIFHFGKKPIGEGLKKRKEDIAKEIEEAGKSEHERMIREAEEKAARMKRDADFLLEQERKQSTIDLTKGAIEQAAVKAQGLLANTITEDDHARLCEEFLTDLMKKPAVAATAAATAGGAA